MEKIVEIKKVTQKYIKNEKEITVLENINYNFEKGKFYCIIGKSGSGKTTLIKLIGTALNNKNKNIIIDGDVLIDGIAVKDMSDNEQADIRYKTIGFVYQDYNLVPYMNAFENVMLPLYLNKGLKVEEMKKKSYELLEELGLKGRELHFPKELSGGEQQRVAIARALANNPKIILADEPTGSLDSENEIMILELLKSLTDKGICVIVVSHNKIVKKYADNIIEIKNKNLEDESYE